MAAAKIRLQDLGAPIQRLLKDVKEEINEDDVQLLKLVSVKEMAKIYDDMASGKVTSEQMWKNLKAQLMQRKRLQELTQQIQQIQETEVTERTGIAAEESSDRDRLTSDYVSELEVLRVSQRDRVPIVLPVTPRADDSAQHAEITEPKSTADPSTLDTVAEEEKEVERVNVTTDSHVVPVSNGTVPAAVERTTEVPSAVPAVSLSPPSPTFVESQTTSTSSPSPSMSSFTSSSPDSPKIRSRAETVPNSATASGEYKPRVESGMQSPKYKRLVGRLQDVEGKLMGYSTVARLSKDSKTSQEWYQSLFKSAIRLRKEILEEERSIAARSR